ncbi:MAG: hypothetical protein ABL974_11370 [Prosthecobacter sp.]
MRFPLFICVLQWAGVLGLCPAAQAQQSPAQITPAPIPDSARLGKVSPLGKAPDWSKLESFAKTITKEEFEKAWRQIYSEENGLPPPFQIGDTALDVPTGNAIKPIFRLPFRDPKEPLTSASKPSWRRARDLAPLNDRPPLSDLHIAIDPGHIGGQWAAIEERLLSFKPGEAIREGDLSLMTAKVLKERLFKLGAVVSLVRETLEPVTPKRPADFEVEALKVLTGAGFPKPAISYQGLTGDAKLLTVQWQTEKLFYRVSEIHARAERVNQQIKPDMVLCLHFNAEAWGDATSPQFSTKNHLHVMINGCYAPVELEQQDVRYEMLSRLLNRVHEEELPLATSVAESMARATGLPAYIYTRPNARRAGTNPYVYARNLLANRLYECPVVYLEPFVMNHEETYRRLLAEHYLGRTLIGGKLTTSAIEDYVRGVVDGLLAYYKTNRQP